MSATGTSIWWPLPVAPPLRLVLSDVPRRRFFPAHLPSPRPLPQASNNQLRVLPATLGNLPNIRQMWLDHNALEALPPTIGALPPPATARPQPSPRPRPSTQHVLVPISVVCVRTRACACLCACACKRVGPEGALALADGTPLTCRIRRTCCCRPFPLAPRPVPLATRLRPFPPLSAPPAPLTCPRGPPVLQGAA